MLTVVSVIEFATPRMVIDGYVKQLRGYFFGTSTLLLITILISIAANFGWQSARLAEYEEQARTESDEYQSWQKRRDSLQARLDEIPIINAASLKMDNNRLQTEMDRLFGQTAYNSNNQSTGRSVGQMTEQCTKESWYSTKYCNEINALKAKQTNIESELEQARTREQLMQQLEQVNREKPTAAAIDDQLPAIAVETQCIASLLQPPSKPTF